ncbi:MAG: hypothetical protein ABI625_10280 [bacterium]
MLCSALLCVAGSQGSAQQPASPSALRTVRGAIVAGDIIGARRPDFARYRTALVRLCGDSGGHALWLKGGILTPQAEAFLGALAAAESRGLRPSDYDVELLAQRIASGMAEDSSLIAFDAAMSLAAMRFMDHAHRGRIDARSLGFALGVPHAIHDLVPNRLAEFVMEGQPEWASDRIEDSMREGEPPLRVTLDQPLPVYVLYATVVTDDADIPMFYPDLYGHDAALVRTLRLPITPRAIARGNVRQGVERPGVLGGRLTGKERHEL